MTPEQLLTFASVADAGNISRAAELLHLSQPAVSGQLRMLQDWFGEPLYRRSGHGIVLTAAGERLAEHARQLRQVYSQAGALRDAWRGLETGSLRLGASTTAPTTRWRATARPRCATWRPGPRSRAS
ncbi:LysR family transcriptional regulator, partial [Bordetella pertussis]|uniref:LysR family transcriptional regulator n=1 Tax=Bordetella pertussis TaxID=520 RepID=UPI000A6B6BE2